MPKLVSGEWTGTMCLTEPQCGTDLGQVKTKAEPVADGTYKITGTKIFISAGEHDLAENIVHIVLARLPDAPQRHPRHLAVHRAQVPHQRRWLAGRAQHVKAGALEHKMGIRASATCVMNFDDATGYMIAEPNKGLEAMFTFMNTARIGTAVQGVAHAELSYQGSLPYAKERRSMRACQAKKTPDQVADALIWHADVRRMLLTQKAWPKAAAP
jgi:alkylation response protein AidB-like acyl-CoA dehydrogenase